MPDTSQSGGVPGDGFSGLGQAFDPETPFDFCSKAPTQKRQNYLAPLVTTVPTGTKYFIKQTNLFTPPGDSHAYQPWPDFEVRFPYNNRESLLLEYRIHPQKSPISYANGFNPFVGQAGDEYSIYFTETGRAGGAYLWDINGDGVLDWVPLRDPRVLQEGRNVRMGVSVTF